MKSRASRPGVTLVEMLVVLAIILMLAGVLVMVFKRLDVQAKEKVLSNTFTILDSALAEFQDANGTFPDPSREKISLGNTDKERGLRNEFMCRKLLDEPQSRVIMDTLDGRTLMRAKPPVPTLAYDPWSIPLDYVYSPGDNFPLVRSAGPDKTFGTLDDIKNR